MSNADAQMLKGVLPMLLLALLHQQQDYGYALVLRLRAAGLTGAAEGSVYPALSRLEAHGALVSHLQASPGGPARKYYSPTPAGAAELTRARTAWDGLAGTVASVTARLDDTRPTDSCDSGGPGDPAPIADHPLALAATSPAHPSPHPLARDHQTRS